ncbi:MAG TPA: GNAT family N-acetyltransferase [Myxococcaceae bacterium]|jgi:ribosomal protein S18 acetylase RimI-like enzyme
MMTDAELVRRSQKPAVIRPVTPQDTVALMAVLDATGLFPGSVLEELLKDHFAGRSGDGHHWLTYDDDGPVGVAYYAPERMTQGTWNVYLMAVHPNCQGGGRGAALLAHMERTLAARGGRVVLVETSGLDSFERTRAFYRKCGYHQEARIREFYQAGEDKIVFWKKLAGAPKT